MTATAAWPIFEAALVGRDFVAERTMSFRFAKPADWTYRAGQFIDITLLDPPETDAEGNTRGFSISSAPSEDVIMITTRLRDTAFKRVLQTMPLGTAVKIEGAVRRPAAASRHAPRGRAGRRHRHYPLPEHPDRDDPRRWPALSGRRLLREPATSGRSVPRRAP